MSESARNDPFRERLLGTIYEDNSASVSPHAVFSGSHVAGDVEQVCRSRPASAVDRPSRLPGYGQVPEVITGSCQSALIVVCRTASALFGDRGTRAWCIRGRVCAARKRERG